MPRVAACPDVRQAIVDAATVLMERFGFQKMTIDDIAQEAGIGKATIYGYFENKQEVGLAVIDRYHAQVLEQQRLISGRPLPIPEKVRTMVLERVMSAFDIAGRYCRSVDDSLAALRPIVIRRRGRFGEEEAKLLGEVIALGMQSGQFQSGDALNSARTILTCVSGLMPYNLSPRERNERDEVLRQANEVLDLILRGMEALPIGEQGKHGRTSNRRRETPTDLYQEA